MTDTPNTDDRHAMKMAKKKAARDKIMATKTDKKGLVIVHTGKGKGKSSAAFGMIFRCIAHDMKCGVVQFIKGGMVTTWSCSTRSTSRYGMIMFQRQRSWPSCATISQR